MSFAVPETAGVGWNFVSKYDSTVRSSAEFKFEINKLNSKSEEIFFKNAVNLEDVYKRQYIISVKKMSLFAVL